jgi:hypothetical protein
VTPCTYLAEKPYLLNIISMTPYGPFKGFFSVLYRREIMGLYLSHFPFGTRVEYVLLGIAAFGEVIDHAK